MDDQPIVDLHAELDAVKARLTKLEMAVANLQQDIDTHVKPARPLPLDSEGFYDPTLDH